MNLNCFPHIGGNVNCEAELVIIKSPKILFEIRTINIIIINFYKYTVHDIILQDICNWLSFEYGNSDLYEDVLYFAWHIFPFLTKRWCLLHVYQVTVRS